jgi:hypothetical protein
MKTRFKILFVWVAILLLTMLIDNIAHAQNNGTFKAIYSYNVSDTAAAKATRTALQTSQGSTGGLYFDKGRNKWKIWSGSKGSASQDSTWVDLPIFAGTGTVTSVSGTAPIAVATGTTTPVISMPAAALAQAGYVNTASQTFGGVKTLGSPVFTGVPVAPTAAPGTNTTQLATTAFVTAAIPSAVTASNGLTKTVNNIALGGTLSTNTTIDANTHDFTVGGNGGVFSLSGTSYFSSVDITADGTGSLSFADIVTGGLSVDASGMFITDTRVSPKGLESGGDYSATYSARSYVDKSYADTKIDGTMVSTRVPFGVDANSLKTDGTGTFTYTEGASGYTTVNHIRMGVPPWYGSVTYGIVSDNPAFGVNVSSADGTVGTPTPFQVTIYGGKAYTVGNNLGGDVTIGSGTGNGTSRSGNVIIDLGSTRGSLFGYLKILNIPTSSAGLPSGAVYSNAGILTIVP